MTVASSPSLPAPPRSAFLLVQLAAVGVLAGRAWQHIFWDAPFRTLLWDEQWMRPLVESLTDMSWGEYVRDAGVDATIQACISGFGWLYAVAAVVALFIRYLPRVIGRVLWVAAGALFFLAFLYWKEKFWNLGQLLEYALQVGAPVLLYHLRYRHGWTPRFRFGVKVLIALTFVCHGLYAVGYYPRPGVFTQMILDSLPVTEATAHRILDLAGLLDFILAVAIFFPRRVALPFLYYAVFWGFLTAFARFWANLYPDYWQAALHQHLHPFVLRWPHALIPLALALVLQWDRPSPAARE